MPSLPACPVSGRLLELTWAATGASRRPLASGVGEEAPSALSAVGAFLYELHAPRMPPMTVNASVM
jgi:hypothetical protein